MDSKQLREMADLLSANAATEAWACSVCHRMWRSVEEAQRCQHEESPLNALLSKVFRE